MIQLTNQPIDTQEVLAQVSSPRAGAVVLFLGTTREFTRGRQTLSLNYECYAEMAEKKLAEIDAEAQQRALAHLPGLLVLELHDDEVVIPDFELRYDLKFQIDARMIECQSRDKIQSPDART